jgi:hypothetical protein
MSRNRKGSRTGRCDRRISLCALQRRGGPRGRLVLALGKEASPPGQRTCPRAVETQCDGGTVPPSACRGGACGCDATRLRSSRKLVPPRREPPHCDVGACPRPGRVRTRVIAPRLLRARSWQHVLEPRVLQPRGAMAKRCRGQRRRWSCHLGGSRVPAVGRQQTFCGQDARPAWQSTGAAATCRGAPLPCRGATAIPARNPGPADPNCRTVP